MWRIHKWVVVLWPDAILNLLSFIADCEHGRDKAIQLFFWFRLSRLNHEGSSYREAHGWSVETVVNQALCDVIVSDARFFLKRADVDDCLVGDKSVLTRVKKWECLREFLGHVISA